MVSLMVCMYLWPKIAIDFETSPSFPSCKKWIASAVGCLVGRCTGVRWMCHDISSSEKKNCLETTTPSSQSLAGVNITWYEWFQHTQNVSPPSSNTSLILRYAFLNLATFCFFTQDWRWSSEITTSSRCRDPCISQSMNHWHNSLESEKLLIELTRPFVVFRPSQYKRLRFHS